MVHADQHLDRTVDQDAAHQPVDRRGREVGEHLLVAERDRQVVGVEHLLRRAVLEAPEAQRQMLEPVPAVADRVGAVDHGAAQQGAHRGRVVEVLRADREVVAVAEERGATAPIVVALPVVDGVAALGMHERRGRQLGLQPGAPVVAHVVLHRRRQEIAEQVPDQEVVADLPAQPVARRQRQDIGQALAVGLVAGLAFDGGPAADAVAADAVQFGDARMLPAGPAVQAGGQRLHRPRHELRRRRQHRRRPRAVGRAALVAAGQRWQGDGDGAAAGQRAHRQQHARVGEAQAVTAGRHRPFVGIAGLAVARIVGLDLAQQEAVPVERQQPPAGLARQRVAGQQRRDVEARLAALKRQFLRRHQPDVPVARGIGGAVARPVAAAVDGGVEGRPELGVGVPRHAQRPRLDVPGRRIGGPQRPAQAVATRVALGHDLVAVVGQHQLGLHQQPALAQQQRDVVGGAGKAQQHRAVHGVDGAAADDRRIPLPAVDRRGLAVADLEQLFAARPRRRLWPSCDAERRGRSQEACACQSK